MNLKDKKDAFFKEMTSQNSQDSTVMNRIEEANATNGEIDKVLFQHYKELMKNCNIEQQETLRGIFARMIQGKHPHRKK